MIQSMRDLERTWNSKFNYPWTFFNDVPFTEEFKNKTQAETKAKCSYGNPYPPIIIIRYRADHFHRVDSQRALGRSSMD